MKIKRRMQVTSEIPSASMADVAFLLIVFFMVTTVFAARKGIDFALPKDDPEKATAEIHAVYIYIAPGCEISLDRSPANLSDIQPYIKPKLDINPNKFVIVHTDPEAEYGCTIDVLDELKQLGVKNIALPAKEEISSWGAM